MERCERRVAKTKELKKSPFMGQKKAKNHHIHVSF